MPPQGGIVMLEQVLMNIRVSSHAPARGHHDLGIKATSSNMFQVMPPQGGIRNAYLFRLWRGHRFKSCPRKGASLSVADSPSKSMFQVMPPQGGISVNPATKFCCGLMFQVMPPQGGILEK